MTIQTDRKPPKVISMSDPCSAWTAKANKRVQFGYGLNYLIDIENAVIVDVEATYDEVPAARTMVERTEQRMGLKPQRLAADTAYGTGGILAWVVAKGIEPRIPVRRKDGTLSRDDFRFDKDRDMYVCPTGKVLKSKARPHRPDPALQGEHLRLRPLSPEVQVLPQYTTAHGAARR
jgi:hypothetical protein